MRRDKEISNCVRTAIRRRKNAADVFMLTVVVLRAIFPRILPPLQFGRLTVL